MLRIIVTISIVVLFNSELFAVISAKIKTKESTLTCSQLLERLFSLRKANQETSRKYPTTPSFNVDKLTDTLPTNLSYDSNDEVNALNSLKKVRATIELIRGELTLNSESAAQTLSKIGRTLESSKLSEESKIELQGYALYRTYFNAKVTKSKNLSDEAAKPLMALFKYGKKSETGFWADFARPSMSDANHSNTKLIFNFRYNLLDRVLDPNDKAPLYDKIIAANKEVLTANKNILNPKVYTNYLEMMLSESARIINGMQANLMADELRLDFVAKLMKLSTETSFRGNTYQDEITNELLLFFRKISFDEDGAKNLSKEIESIVINKGVRVKPSAPEKTPEIIRILQDLDFSSPEFLGNFADALRVYKKDAKGDLEKIHDILFYLPTLLKNNTALSDKSRADALGYLLNEMILSNGDENLYGSMFERMITKDLLAYGKKGEDELWSKIAADSIDGELSESAKLSLAYHFNFIKNEQFARSNVTTYRTMVNTAISTLDTFTINNQLTSKTFTDYIVNFVEQGMKTIDERGLELSYRQRPIDMIEMLFAIAKGADITLSKEEQEIVFDSLYRYCQKFYKNGNVTPRVNIKLFNFVTGDY